MVGPECIMLCYAQPSYRLKIILSLPFLMFFIGKRFLVVAEISLNYHRKMKIKRILKLLRTRIGAKLTVILQIEVGIDALCVKESPA